MNFAQRIRFTRMVLLLTTAACIGCAAIASQPANDQERVTEAVRQMYVAFTKDDAAKFHSVTSPDFYSFDGGRRFTGDELLELIRKAHAAGRSYVWTVTESQVHVEGRTAWITYVNRGSVEDATGRKDAVWLESAVLRKDDGVWKIHFFHSTRVPTE